MRWSAGASPPPRVALRDRPPSLWTADRPRRLARGWFGCGARPPACRSAADSEVNCRRRHLILGSERCAPRIILVDPARAPSALDLADRVARKVVGTGAAPDARPTLDRVARKPGCNLMVSMSPEN